MCHSLLQHIRCDLGVQHSTHLGVGVASLGPAVPLLKVLEEPRVRDVVDIVPRVPTPRVASHLRQVVPVLAMELAPLDGESVSLSPPFREVLVERLRNDAPQTIAGLRMPPKAPVHVGLYAQLHKALQVFVPPVLAFASVVVGPNFFLRKLVQKDGFLGLLGSRSATSASLVLRSFGPAYLFLVLCQLLCRAVHCLPVLYRQIFENGRSRRPSGLRSARNTTRNLNERPQFLAAVMRQQRDIDLGLGCGRIHC
mmetsp:Transcript_24012/g.66728  ORF Transcript_24012/g.66728 Transcript_24012/m.66728 type:complete len:253 (+) Transcript_24012:585-1343(+)